MLNTNPLPTQSLKQIIPNTAYQAPIEAIPTVEVATDDSVNGVTGRNEQDDDVILKQNTAYEAHSVMESVPDVHHLDL